MLIIPPPKYRKDHRALKDVLRSAGVPLVLTAATYEPEDPSVLFSFDRAIDITGIVGSLIRVDDQPDGQWLVGVGAELLTPEVVQIDLAVAGSVAGSSVLLSVGAGNGIVAVDDGGMWAGVSGLVLPFG